MFLLKRQAADMKKRKRAGFTFAETLITVALLSIVFLAISGGFVVFQRAYKNITRKANAQVMLSTAIMQVTNDCKNATVYYSNKNDSSKNAMDTSSRGYVIRYYVPDTTKGIIVQPFNHSTEQPDTVLKEIPLLTSKTNTDKMYTDFAWEDTPCTIMPDGTALFSFTIYIKASDEKNKVIEYQKITVRSNSKVTKY